MPPPPINPIIPGFPPDPSVIRVKDTFYLVNSTFHFFPGLPIYSSKDLVSWTHIGNAIHRQTQLSFKSSNTRLSPASADSASEIMHATGGLYAPTLRYHAATGTFYIVCTNVLHLSGDGDGDVKDRNENFVVSTTDIEKGVWSDPVYFEGVEGIDPSLVWDGEEGGGEVEGEGERETGVGERERERVVKGEREGEGEKGVS